MALQPGTRLGPYVILDPLGAGGMGEVYRARDPRLDRDVALKVLPENVARDPARLRRFEQEAKAVAALNHPAILAVFDVGVEGEIPFLVSELLEGRTLRHVLCAGPMSLPEALDVACHVSTGLEAAHDKGIVHRDLKPENLFLTNDGRIKILDFGLARRHGPLPPADVDPDGSTAAGTRPGAVLGTVGYMSPEQVRGEVVDERTDVFSFGCVLYEMLTGSRAFSERSAAETMAAILREDPLQRPSGRPVLPPSLERLLRRCLEKTPERRFRSAHELTLALEVLSGPGSAREAVLRDLKDSGRRWRWPWARAAGDAFPNPPAVGTLRPLPVAGLVVLGLMVLWWRGPALLRPIPPAAAPAERLAVAVAPFAGPDEDSVKEGRVMGALVEKAIAQRLSPNGVTVLGIDQTAQPAADHAAARALAEKMGADIVVWGEVLAIRGETEIQPYFTLASRRSPARSPAADRFGADALAAVGERVGEALVVGSGMPSQIEARKTSATGIGNLVLTLVGVHALYAEGRPEKALALFAQAPRNPETLRYRAEALSSLHRTDEARQALDEALALSPGDAQTWASLGDLHLEAGRYADAAAAYSHAAESGAAFTTRHGILFEGKLYLRERFAAAVGEFHDSGYLLAIDPKDGKVLERYLLPGVASALKAANGVLEVTCEEPDRGGRVGTDIVQVARGKALGPVLLSSSLGLRRAALSNGEALASGAAGARVGTLRSTWSDSRARPRLAEFESTLRAARDRDPTQPWHRFFLAQALSSQGRHAEAEREWEALLASGAFPATPYYEYAHMAARFERLGLRTWADRAFVEALSRRREMPQPIGLVVRFERFFNTPWVTTRGALGSPDPERERLWLVRAREFGLSTEGEDVAAALWERRLRRQGRTAEAEQESQIRRRAQHDPLNVVQMAGRADYALQVYVALGAAALIAGLALLAAAARRRRSRADDSLRLATACFIWRAERRALVLAVGLTALAAGVFLSSVHVVSRIAYVPIGLGDSLGSAGVRAELERVVEGSGTEEARFALAVSNHLAGRMDRARALYESLPANPRARRNLDALRSGSQTPPEPVGSDDLRRAFASVSWRALPRAASDAGEFLASFLLIWSSSKEIIIAVLFGGLVPLSAGVLLLLVLAWSPVGEPAGAESLPRPRRRLVFVPGLADLCDGAPMRGYVALATGVLCIVAIVTKISYAARHAAGPMSADALVWSAGIPGLSEAPFWADLWIYRDAPLWWLLVLLSLALSVGLHLRGLAPRRRKVGREVEGAPPAAGIDGRAP